MKAPNPDTAELRRYNREPYGQCLHDPTWLRGGSPRCRKCGVAWENVDPASVSMSPLEYLAFGAAIVRGHHRTVNRQLFQALQADQWYRGHR